MILKIFNSIGDKEKQDVFLAAIISVKNVNRHPRPTNRNGSNRLFFSQYKVRLDTNEVIVYWKAFCSFFGVRKSVVSHFCKKLITL